MGEAKIKATQFKKMVFLFTIGTSIILVPSALASDAKNDAWIPVLLGTVAALLLIGLYLALARLVPGKTIVEICMVLFGKWIGMFFSLSLFLYSFLLTTLVLRNLGDFLTASMFPETPITAIHLVYLLIVAIGIRYGLSNLARTMDIFYPFIIILFIIFVILLMPEIKFNQIQPVLSNGISPILNATYSYVSFPCLEYVLFLMILPHVEDPREGGKAFVKGMLLGGLVLLAITTLCLLVMGSEMTANNLYASFELAKIIKIGEFLQRVEVIIAVIWFVTIYCKLIVCFYMTIQTFSQSFKLGEYHPLIFPIGMLILAASIIIAPDMGYFISFDRYVWTICAFIFGFVLPLLFLLTAMVRHSWIKSKSGSRST
ncbi:spore germination protein KB [Paenibacillus sp. BK033]|uniref:GerAB/ArcD/ProY family transporter n=1 Tax=Paenibacillus sp. BK033 TaxID=2512133 RepID=UPI00104FDC87|nr:endospore germination permease [Paenibacillus sp. BK033]TCM99035.1 spore germination protein KB [Paenibacillus sp. BK033]